MTRSVHRRFWPQKVRTRLTALYVLLFLVAGSSLLALTYGLLASRLPATSHSAKNAALHNAKLLALCKQEPKAKLVADSVQKQCERAFAAGASAGSQNQRDQTLNSLLLVSLIGLGLTGVASAGLGWLLSGRTLGPMRAITETARRASELHLGERIALTGPDDELKELADTFDEMLGRLDAAFASQKRFVANAAHELRTPLTAMRTSIEVTLSKPSPTPEQLEAMAAKVRRSSERAEATIEALLTLAMSERGPATNDLLDLATAAEDALDHAAPSIAKLKLTVEAALESATTSGDPVLLERMIANLIDNAVRHNNPNGWIRVHTAERNGDAMFEIENSGPDVPEHIIPSLFEPFARAEQRLKPLDGVGLGLSIANAIGIAHHSALLARSRSDGGLHVSIILPGATSDGRVGA
jgi:signal transduction histidine kinase